MFTKRLFFFLIFLTVSVTGFAQNNSYTVADLPYAPVYGLRPEDMSPNTTYAIVVKGDTVPLIFLRTIYLYPPEHFRDKREERYYWKLVRDIKKVYPLAKICFYTFYETMEYLQTIPDKKTREKHLRKMEKDLIKEYDSELRRMTFSQGKLLIRLIDRQCNYTSFDLIRAYRGDFIAHFWQGIAKLFRNDLKDEYCPLNRDFMIERIVVRIDQGQL